MRTSMHSGTCIKLLIIFGKYIILKCSSSSFVEVRGLLLFLDLTSTWTPCLSIYSRGDFIWSVSVWIRWRYQYWLSLEYAKMQTYIIMLLSSSILVTVVFFKNFPVHCVFAIIQFNSKIFYCLTSVKHLYKFLSRI